MTTFTLGHAQAATDHKLPPFLKYFADNNLESRAAVTERYNRSHSDDDSDNGDTSESESPLCGFKLTYRLTGRATQAEERFLRSRDRDELKSSKYKIDGQEVNSKAKFTELKALFDEHGWSGFDKDQKSLFDNLKAVFGGRLISEKDISATKDFMSLQRDLNLSYLDGPDSGNRKKHVYDLGRTFIKPGWNVTVLGDGITGLKCLSGKVWHDAFSTNAVLASPSNHRAILNEWRLKYPESEYPDSCADGSGLIQGPWEPSDYEKKTDRTDVLADKLKVLLDFRNQDPLEPLQTNFFVGDNDNYIHEEGDPKKVKRDAESKMPMRPSENEMLARVISVHFERRYVARPDSYNMDYRLIPKKGFTVGPDGKSVPLCGDVEFAENGTIKRMGHLRFHMNDKDLADRYSKHRGEMIEYFSGGKFRPVNDASYQITGGPPAVTVLNALFDKELGAKVSNSDLKKWKPAERSELEQKAETRWEKFEVELYGSVYGEGKERCEYYERRLQGTELEAWLILPSVTLTLNEARAFCKLPPVPANENRIRFGLPYDVKSAGRLSMSADGLRGNASTGQTAKAQTATAMLTDSPRDVLLRKEENELRDRAKSELTPDDVQVVESFLSAANFIQVGRETGDEGKHERTQEKNAQLRVLHVAAKLDAISARIAA